MVWTTKRRWGALHHWLVPIGETAFACKYEPGALVTW
jgi:hypothetical protein